MKRASALLTSLALWGCPPAEEGARPQERASLHVTLPAGWRATSVANGLQAGPGGRVVLQLESGPRPFPEAAALEAALGKEGVRVLEKESEDDYLGLRYAVPADGGDREAFLGVRRTGARATWCSTTAGAKSDEVQAAVAVCRSLSWEN